MILLDNSILQTAIQRASKAKEKAFAIFVKATAKYTDLPDTFSSAISTITTTKAIQNTNVFIHVEKFKN